MYNQQEMALKIKQTAKEKKISLKMLLDSCDLNINYISDLSKGNQALVSNVYKIADYLEVSVDYLLGRTDNQSGYSNNNLSNSDNVAFGENAQVNNNGKLDGISKEMLNEFEKLPFKDKTKVMSLIAELNEKEGA